MIHEGTMFKTEIFEGAFTVKLPPLLLHFPQKSTRIKIVRIKPLGAVHYIIRLPENTIAKAISVYSDSQAENLHAILSAARLVSANLNDNPFFAFLPAIPRLATSFYKSPSSRPTIIAAEIGGLRDGSCGLIEIRAHRGAVKSCAFASDLRKSLIATVDQGGMQTE